MFICRCAKQLAQIVVGSLAGRVTDSPGAVIPNAKVTLTEISMATRYSIGGHDARKLAQINGLRGSCVATPPALRARSGVRSSGLVLNSGWTSTAGVPERPDSTLEVGETSETVSVTAMTLAVGSVTETVTVTAAAVMPKSGTNRYHGGRCLVASKGAQ